MSMYGERIYILRPRWTQRARGFLYLSSQCTSANFGGKFTRQTSTKVFFYSKFPIEKLFGKNKNANEPTTSISADEEAS